jgi:2-polyprenyl-3-methyl-5-hydroxy-6-metoxy-1,4-benzoquinol methylase
MSNRNVMGPALGAIVDGLYETWPAHRDYVEERFGSSTPDHLVFCERLARKILNIVGGGLSDLLANYRWTCARMLEEEYRFAVTGRYRHTSFEDVRREVYADNEYMSRYTDGLLLSQLMWANHASALEVYEDRFLSLMKTTSDLLEVGPGHGLLLAAASERPHRRLVGWDISAASIESTRRALRSTSTEPVVLELRDLLEAAAPERFSFVVASELVEHLDRPADAVRRLGELAGEAGLVYLNIPVNSPAPDHIALWESPEQLFSFVERNGLRIVERHVFAMTGRTEQEARAGRLTLSCVAICRSHVGPHSAV